MSLDFVIAPQTFFEPDVCTRLIAGVLREIQDFNDLTKYIKTGWHDEVKSLTPLLNNIYNTLPYMFSKPSAKLPRIIETFRDVILAIINAMKKRPYQSIATAD